MDLIFVKQRNSLLSFLRQPIHRATLLSRKSALKYRAGFLTCSSQYSIHNDNNNENNNNHHNAIYMPPSQPNNGKFDPRWLTITKRRIGKCLMFGLKPSQIEEAGRLLQRLARDWRELILGSEGFLTDVTRRAMFRHNVVWGEMVNFFSIFSFYLKFGMAFSFSLSFLIHQLNNNFFFG